ncbi:MAG: sigma-70 family RNA polymerase sigma factor, partial [Bacteroidales bacterium]|nr:sigma-70 family RNA polymerase sigma factor [Bacteroidales bacterium]
MSDEDFIELLTQNEWLLYHIGYTFAKGDSEVLRDLYQEMVCNLWSSRNQFRGDCSPKNWMYRVALNTAISLWRKEVRQPRFIPLPVEMEQWLRDEPDNPLRDELYRLIDLLPKADQALIYLYIDGAS